MRRLTGTDAVFLSLETPSWHQHVGGLTILEPGERPLTYEAFVAEVDRRLPFAPKFRWKLKHAPFQLDRPVWIDDTGFDVRRHVRRIGVPAPGGRKETAEVAGTLLGIQLDRRRPLWELWFMEGLAAGRVGLLMKYHHCLLDGIAGASLATALMDLEPDPTSQPEPPKPSEVSAGPEPSDVQLLTNMALPVLGRPMSALRYLGTAAAKGLTMANFLRRDRQARSIIRAPVTPFNHPIGPRRGLAFSSVAMDDVRSIKEAHGVKVNDVVLALCAAALRSYLLDREELPAQPLITAVPMSTRAEGNAAMDNQVTTTFVSLATDVSDPVERLRAVHRSASTAKEMSRAVGARQIQSLGEVASPLILGTAIRAIYGTQLVTRTPLRVNTLVANVPGPPVQLYSCGAKVMGIYSSSVILEGMGVNATVFSYLNRIDFGFHVDPDLVPDPWAIADAVPAAVSELMTASGLGEPKYVKDPFDNA
jgi:WS/DGAT/MGAT family acyltransferase